MPLISLPLRRAAQRVDVYGFDELISGWLMVRG